MPSLSGLKSFLFLLPHFSLLLVHFPRLQDAEFDLVEVPLSAEQRRLYRECSTLFFDLRSAVARAMAITGEGGANSPMKMFW